MKTLKRTIPLLLIFLFVAYFSPFIFANEDNNSIALPEESAAEKNDHSFEIEAAPLDQSLVPTAGFANYTGMAVDDFLVTFGNPQEVKSLSESEEIWIYGSTSQDYIQLTVKDYVIQEILVLGSKVDVKPFQMGMERNNVYQVASFHPTFEIPYGGQTIQMKLNETELNSQPLIAFDNQTYAVLTMDSQANTLIGIQYMTNESLVQSGLYEKKSYSSVAEEEPRKVNSAIQDQWKAELTVSYINIMRVKIGLEPLEYNLVLTAFGNELYDYDNQLKAEENVDSSVTPGTPKSSTDDSLVINEEANVQKIEGLSDENLSAEQDKVAKSALLDESIIENFLSEQEVSLEQVRLVYQPVQSKPSHYTLHWFILSDYRDILLDSQMKRIGITFRGNELLLILDEGSEIQL